MTTGPKEVNSVVEISLKSGAIISAECYGERDQIFDLVEGTMLDSDSIMIFFEEGKMGVMTSEIAAFMVYSIEDWKARP